MSFNISLFLLAAQFTWNRERNVNFAAFIGNEEVIDEEGEIEEEESNASPSQEDVKDSSSVFQSLSDYDKGSKR